MADPTPLQIPTLPGSMAMAARLFQGVDPVKVVAAYPLLYLDYYFRVWHFDEDSIEARWAVASTGGATAITAFAYSAFRNGSLLGDTGTDDNAAIALHLDNAIFDAADNPWFLVRWLAPAAVSGFSFEIGWSDPKTDEALPGIDDIDTPSAANGITDGGGIHMDTDQTLTTAAAWGVGTSTAVAKTNIGTFTPTISTWQHTLVGVRAGQTYVAHWNGRALVNNTIYSVLSGPDVSVLMRPSMLFRTRNTTQKDIRINMVAIGAERNAT